MIREDDVAWLAFRRKTSLRVSSVRMDGSAYWSARGVTLTHEDIADASRELDAQNTVSDAVIEAATNELLLSHAWAISPQLRQTDAEETATSIAWAVITALRKEREALG